MIEPKHTIDTIPSELDADGWSLEFDTTDIRIYSKFGASNSRIIGFKTVTEHPVQISKVVGLLRDVNKAMELVNHQFVHGEVLEQWPTDFDLKGTLVRTSFKMPWPFTDREFPHGLHSVQLNDRIHIIGYTPVERDDIAVQDGFVRCPMYISGQRVTELESGATRVEHLMVYELGGSVSNAFQDSVMKAGHIGAYKAEWRKLREVLFPTSIKEIDNELLTRLLTNALEVSASWKTIEQADSGTVSSGRLAYCPKTIYRTDIEVGADIRTVVNVIADRSLEYLPEWNKEFIKGDVLQVLRETDTKKEWLIHVQYATPGPIANREYVYYFSREWISDEEAIIIYCSVESEKTVPTEFVRALLYPTVHRCVATQKGTKIEHLLATDLGGNLGKYQDGMLLRGGLADAHVRDLNSQRKLFQQLPQ